MYPDWGAAVFDLVLLIWLGLLSLFFWEEKKYLYKLFPKNKELDIREKLDELIRAVEENGRKSTTLGKNLIEVRKEGLGHIQNLEVLRYNPYNDTGGDQSFSTALLDGKYNGFILTSLHSRAGTRIYIKKITNGKSDLELSKEEKQVLDEVVGNQ